MNAPISLKPSVRQADLGSEREIARIEAFVKAAGGSLFHRPAWILGAQAGCGHKAIGLLAENAGAIVGWLPLSAVKSRLFGKALVSSGFGVGGGILAESDAGHGLLAQAAVAFARDNGWPSIELRGGVIPDSWEQIMGKHAQFSKELADDDEAQLLSIKRRQRAEVRKGLRSDLRVTTGSSRADLRAHYAIYSESVRNLGTPVFPKRLFTRMVEQFGDAADILTVWDGERPVASVLSFYHRQTVMPFWGGGLFAARKLRANELAHYKLMLHARGRGMTRFDFGRSKIGSGPYAYKKNWGFEPEPLVYGRWSDDGQPVRDIDPNSASYQRKIALWKRLPLPIANLAGPLISRGLA